MLAEREATFARRAYDLEPELSALSAADGRGVPLAGRRAEIAALRHVGRRDASLGRIFEGHLNGAQLVARCGNAEQRAAALRAIADGHLFGVWNTQDADGVRIVTAGGRPRLSGAKTWASGAGSITRPVVTAAWPDGRVQMCLLRMDEIDAQIDGSAWQPLGMQASDSFRIGFDGVELTPFDLIGEPGDYEGQPWFLAGALRFAAVQTGIAERIVAETLRYLRARARDGDQMQCARAAEMKIAVRSALLWLEAGVMAWSNFDDEPSAAHCAELARRRRYGAHGRRTRRARRHRAGDSQRGCARARGTRAFRGSRARSADVFASTRSRRRAAGLGRAGFASAML